DRVIADPAHPYTRALIASMPVLSGARGARPALQGETPSPVNRPSGCAFHPRCPIAAQICRQETPALRPIADTHRVACHLAASRGKDVLRYAAIRVFRAGLTVVAVVTFTFLVLRLSGDPALQILGTNVPASALKAFRHAWGLDQPLWLQYLSYF